jgi:hypothetical protein
MTDETPDRLDELLQDAARTYNRPPDERQMPLDDMWRDIDARVFGDARRSSHRMHRMYWLGIAAALLVGVGLGRLSSLIAVLGRGRAMTQTTAQSGSRADTPARMATSDAPKQPLDPVTEKYIGQATALLVALPSEASGRIPDRPFTKRANELLLTTRLLLDSPTAQDPAFRNLLEDLELVLVQVVQLEKDRDHARQTELELIHQALEQRDVIPRLRTAASENAAD